MMLAMAIGRMGGIGTGDPGYQAYLAAMAELEQEAGQEEAIEQPIRDFEDADGIRETLSVDPVWSADVRWVNFIDARGRSVEFLTYGRREMVRAMPVKGDEPQASRHPHPNRGRGGPHDHPVSPDSLAVELLCQLPQEEQTAARLLEVARKNEAAYARYRELCSALGSLTLTKGI